MRRWKLAGTLPKMRTPLFLRTATSLDSEKNPLLVSRQDSRGRATQRAFAAGRGVKRHAEQGQLVDDGGRRFLRRNDDFLVWRSLNLCQRFCEAWRSMRDRRVLLLDGSPDNLCAFSNSFLRNELTSHCHEQVVVLAHGLQAFRRKLSLHGECDEQLASHQPQASLLGGIRIGKVLDCDLLCLADPP